MSAKLLVDASEIEIGYDTMTAVTRSSFRIPEGGVTAIIGPNGSGKSTLLHAIAGIRPIRSGSLTVLGGNAEDAWKTCAYVMQTVSFPLGTPITVKEVVGMGRYPSKGWFGRFNAEDRERVRQAMDRLDITDLAGRHLDELSGGQRQRVYVAQALAQDHVAILMDEPLTGLDLVSARTIDSIIHSEKEVGHSVILTTHDLEEARAADQVILMSGKVTAAGPPNEVLTPANLREAYGLGSLHGASEDVFMDGPLDTHRH